MKKKITYYHLEEAVYVAIVLGMIIWTALSIHGCSLWP